MINVIESVLKDERFQLSSPQAKAAHNTASTLLSWIQEPSNLKQLGLFSVNIILQLRTCFVKTKTQQLKRAKMWGLYHKLRTSSSFKTQWTTFSMKAIGENPPVGFYQFVTHEVFKKMIKEEFPINVEPESPSNPLTPEEEKALRYVAGYVCRNIHDKLKHTSSDGDQSMIDSLKAMTVGDMDDDSDAWLTLVDRGGLWHINDKVYAVFTIMEEHIRQYLSTASSKPEGTKQLLINELLKNDDLLFEWLFCSNQMNNETGMLLLKYIVELYVTVRGFAFASSCLELYKQSQKTTVTKQKALRKKLTHSE